MSKKALDEAFIKAVSASKKRKGPRISKEALGALGVSRSDIKKPHHMYQSITTKYLGPTDTKGARIKATATGGATHTVSYDHELDIEDNHIAGAKALVEKLDWGQTWYGGGLHKSGTFVFVHGEPMFSSKKSRR